MRISMDIISFLRFKLKLVIFAYFKILIFLLLFYVTQSLNFVPFNNCTLTSHQCLHLCPLCTITPAIPHLNQSQPLPPPELTPSAKRIPTEPTPPHTPTLPEPDQRGGSSGREGCWFRWRGVVQVWGCPRRPGGGMVQAWRG